MILTIPIYENEMFLPIMDLISVNKLYHSLHKGLTCLVKFTYFSRYLGFYCELKCLLKKN